MRQCECRCRGSRPHAALSAGTRVLRSFWRQKAAWILDVNGVDAERHKFTCLARKIIVGMDGTDRIHDTARSIEADLFCGAHRHLHVAHVVQRVVGRVIADAIGKYSFRRQFDDIVRKKLEREQTLAARHHDQRRLLDPSAKDAHSLPRVLTQVANTDIEDGAPNQIDCLKSSVIEAWRQILHHCRGHARRPQTLMRVAQCHVDQVDGSFVAHQCVTACRFSSTHRVWTSARANSGCCRSRAWNGTVVSSPDT